MRLSKETVERKLNEVPDNIREAVTSDEVAANLVAIGQEHNLHIDQIGILEEESLYVMLGITESDEFLRNLRDRIGLSTDEASKLAQDINDRILAPIRTNLQKGTDGGNPQAAAHPEKDAILAEIEDPKPVAQPISTTRPVAAAPAAPQPRTDLPTVEPSHLPTNPQPKPIQNPQSQTPTTKPGVTNEFIAGKMTETVNMPPQKYSADPYREPLN